MSSSSDARQPRLLNYTPHEVDLELFSGVMASYPSSGVARVGEKPDVCAVCHAYNYPFYVCAPAELDPGRITGLPDPAGFTPKDGLIVSTLVAEAVASLPEKKRRELWPGRLFAPNTGTGPHGVRRGADGTIEGVGSLREF